MNLRLRRDRLWLYYPAALLPVTALYLAGPLNTGPVFNAIGASAAIAILVATKIYNPRSRWPWMIFAIGQILFVSGDVLAYNYERFFGRMLPFPSIADPFYLAVYPCLVTGLMLLVHQRNPARDRASLIDSLIISIGAATISWVLLIAPYAHDQSSPLGTRLISIAYPVMDLLVLLVTVRLAVGAGRRGTSYWLLVSGVSALLVTDAIYGYLLLHGGYTTGRLLDLGWILFYGLFGAGALNPSMRQLSEPVMDPTERLSGRRLVLLAVATMLAPVILAIRSADHGSLDLYVLIGAAIVLFLLVVVRMAGLVRVQEASSIRERTLREASEALVKVTTRDEIYAAALSAAQSLDGTEGEARLYLETSEPDMMAAVAAVPAGNAKVPPLPIKNLSIEERARLTEGRAIVVATQSDPRAFATNATHICLVPLFVRDRLSGLLAVFLHKNPTRPYQESLRTLGFQVSLALESAALTEETARRRAEMRFGSLIRNSSDVVAIVTPEGKIAYISPSVESLLGIPSNRLINRKLAELVHPDDVQSLDLSLAPVADQSPGQRLSFELRLRRRDDTYRDVEALATNLLGDPDVEGIVLNMRDVSERKAFEGQLAHQAFHDTLTGLPNRALFRNRVEHALERHHREKFEMAVLFLDIDDFKGINDSLGHTAGDELLSHVAQRLHEAIRVADTAARLGGDEFAVLLDGLESDLTAIEIAERIMAGMSEPTLLEGREISPRVSIGIAFAEHDGVVSRNADDLLRNADVAMYLAKETGKAGYQVFEPAMHTAALKRLELKSDLQRALREHELRVVYQPIVRLENGSISGFEALVRWNHPQRGNVPPLEFIPLAEDTGSIIEIGQQVLKKACETAAELQGEVPNGDALTMAVNVSLRQLRHPGLADEVSDALTAGGLQAQNLTLELTESVMMQDYQLAIERLKDLRKLGVRLAIDDFGTGYSSLTYIRQFPIDVLKVDKSFINEMEEGHGIGQLTETILQLASALGLHAVAEGIEHTMQLEQLRTLGCEFGQGFLLHKPTELEGLADLIAENRRYPTSI